ncbi:hypothetical protein F2Q69_00051244 [Brassica cretica]|uniref:Uncharacterized protein n=1 Tax=Brassica cretica TaxID=69181 RepID=A0A8S9PZI8_BRACR|nr:hypothetical protein F2Q69_00051244 [Brassica cretica]
MGANVSSPDQRYSVTSDLPSRRQGGHGHLASSRIFLRTKSASPLLWKSRTRISGNLGSMLSRTPTSWLGAQVGIWENWARKMAKTKKMGRQRTMAADLRGRESCIGKEPID